MSQIFFNIAKTLRKYKTGSNTARLAQSKIHIRVKMMRQKYPDQIYKRQMRKFPTTFWRTTWNVAFFSTHVREMVCEHG